MRVCALDLGDSRTGVAFSDLTLTLVGESFVIHEKNTARLMDRLCEMLSERKPDGVAVGCPVNMNGTRGPRAERAERLAAELAERTGLRVDLIDERRTTVEAHNILGDNGVYRQKRKDTVDAVAASLILEIYMAKIKREAAEK